MQGYGEYVGSHKHYCEMCREDYVCSEELECELGYRAPCQACYVAGLIAREEEIARDHEAREGEEEGPDPARQTESVRAARAGAYSSGLAKDRWSH